MTEDGYSRYEQFFQAEPLLCLEWHDPATEAVAWLVINSLTGNATGGGTRMKPDANRNEAVFLAKTMEIKFRVCGPEIGGAKSVIRFSPRSQEEKRGVLSRYYHAISPYLRACYGTAGDLNVDEIKEVIPITRDDLGLAHPQEGIVRGFLHAPEETHQRIVDNLRQGVEMAVWLPDLPGANLKVANLITGHGLASAVRAFFEGSGDPLQGQRVLVEGFGAVGGSSAYYLHRAGAKVVGVVTRNVATGNYRWQVDSTGLDVLALLRRREGADLPAGSPEGPDPVPFWQTEADIFVPAARSESVDSDILSRLSRLGVRVIACGANVPFKEGRLGDLAVQQAADAQFVVIPDFIANCGMARCFAYLMHENADLTVEAMFDDTERITRSAMEMILSGHSGGSGMLRRAFDRFIPPAPQKTFSG